MIGGSGGSGLETARRARAEGADVILPGHDPARLQCATAELGALTGATYDSDGASSSSRKGDLRVPFEDSVGVLTGLERGDDDASDV